MKLIRKRPRGNSYFKESSLNTTTEYRPPSKTAHREIQGATENISLGKAQD